VAEDQPFADFQHPPSDVGVLHEGELVAGD
jgi:hypothetical protein